MRVSRHLHYQAALSTWKEALDPTEQEAGTPQNHTIHFGEDKHPLTLPQTEPQFLCPQVHDLVTRLPKLTYTVTNPLNCSSTIPIIREHKTLNVDFSVQACEQ